MPSSQSDPAVSPHDLPWISFSKLCELVDLAFSNVFMTVRTPSRSTNEPTLLTAFAAMTNRDMEDTLKVMREVDLVKSIQNAAGALHQSILGSVDGWLDSGPRGGGIDIRSEGPVPLAGNRIVLMEVKMRWNTITGKDQKYMFDTLLNAVKSNWGSGYPAVGYIAQIIPRTQKSYNRPWKTAERSITDSVRAIDGRTAYHLVTGDPNALEDVLRIMPFAFSEVLASKNLEHYAFSNTTDFRILDERIKVALPLHSALEKSE